MANKYTGDREQLLERIAEAVEAFTGSTPDNTSDRQNATGLALERIAEALENGGGGSSNIVEETYNRQTNKATLNRTFKEIREMMQKTAVFIKSGAEDEGNIEQYFVYHLLGNSLEICAIAFNGDGFDGEYIYTCQNENEYPSRDA